MAACGERHRGTGSGGWALNTPSCRQEALEPQRHGMPGLQGSCGWYQGCSKTVCTDRETEAQPESQVEQRTSVLPGRAPVAGRLGQALGPISRAGCSLGVGLGRPGLRATRTRISPRHLNSLQFLTCRRAHSSQNEWEVGATPGLPCGTWRETLARRKGWEPRAPSPEGWGVDANGAGGLGASWRYRP